MSLFQHFNFRMSSFVVLAVASMFALSGCGGGGSSGVGTTATNTISGVANLGVVSNGIVTAYQLTNGSKVAQVGTPVTTASDGSFSIDVGSYTGPVLFELSGDPNGNTTYIDEGTGQTVTLPATSTVQSVLPAVAANQTVAITSLTHIVAIAAQKAAANGIPDKTAITDAEQNVVRTFGLSGVNVLTTKPADLTASTGTGNDAKYASVLGGLALQAASNTTNTTVKNKPTAGEKLIAQAEAYANAMFDSKGTPQLPTGLTADDDFTVLQQKINAFQKAPPQGFKTPAIVAIPTGVPTGGVLPTAPTPVVNTGTMTVTVIDQDTGMPISGAIVVLDQNAQQQTTNAQGKAAFTVTPGSSHDVHVFADGYVYDTTAAINLAAYTVPLQTLWPPQNAQGSGVYVQFTVTGAQTGSLNMQATWNGQTVFTGIWQPQQNPAQQGQYQACLPLPGTTVGQPIGQQLSFSIIETNYTQGNPGTAKVINRSGPYTVAATTVAVDCWGVANPPATAPTVQVAMPALPAQTTLLASLSVTPPQGIQGDYAGVMVSPAGRSQGVPLFDAFQWAQQGQVVGALNLGQVTAYDWTNSSQYSVFADYSSGTTGDAWFKMVTVNQGAAANLTPTIQQPPSYVATGQWPTVTWTPSTSNQVIGESVDIQAQYCVNAQGQTLWQGQTGYAACVNAQQAQTPNWQPAAAAVWTITAPKGTGSVTLPIVPTGLQQPLLMQGQQYQLALSAFAAPGWNYTQAAQASPDIPAEVEEYWGGAQTGTGAWTY